MVLEPPCVSPRLPKGRVVTVPLMIFFSDPLKPLFLPPNVLANCGIILCGHLSKTNKQTNKQTNKTKQIKNKEKTNKQTPDPGVGVGKAVKVTGREVVDAKHLKLPVYLIIISFHN